MNTKEKQQLEEPLNKKPRIEECKENANNNKNLSEIEEDKEKEKKDQPHRYRRRLPLEMECEVFKNFKLEIQQKFIWGMGRGIYGMFRHKLLTKIRRLCNPKSNCWKAKNTKLTEISADGLGIMSNGYAYAHAEQGFGISVANARNDDFPGTILYYFEITQLTSTEHIFDVGFANGDGPDADPLYHYFKSGYDYYWLGGNIHTFQRSNGALEPIRNGLIFRGVIALRRYPAFKRVFPIRNGIGDVYGCGLLLSPENKVAIFFTGNGVLLGKQIPLTTSANILIPAILIKEVSLKANFGDDPANEPFKYDIGKCPGLVFE